MREVVVQIPNIEAEQNIEITVKINGKKRTLNYRVEIVEWENTEGENPFRIETLRRVVQEHEKDWDLIHIGAPSNSGIPVMFRQKKHEIV